MTVPARLESRHLDELHASAIPDDLIAGTGIRSISHEEAEDFGFRSPGSLRGMFFPYPDPTTGRPSERFGRLKPDTPVEGRKYLQPVAETNRFYFTPGTTLQDLLDPTVEILLVEGEKKALSVLAWARRTGRRCIVIGIGGCNSWLRAIKAGLPDGSLGKVGSEPIPDFDLVTWQGRRVTLGLDGDVVTNPAVAAAESGLAREVLTRGGRVFVIRIPADKQGNRRGADDLLVQEGDAAWEVVLAAALPKYDGTASASNVLRDVGLDSLGDQPALELVETALYKLGIVMRGANPLLRRLVREGAIRTLTLAGLKSPASIVDAALLTPKGDDMAHDGQGRPLVLSAPEPWPDPVEGAQLLQEIHEVLERHLVLPPSAAVTIALWVLHAHTFQASSTSPFLTLKSPTKRAGKTSAMSIVTGLVPRALPTSNISPAAVFRTIEAYGPTLLVDEADSFLSLSEELRGILNSGHTRPTASIIRTVGEDHEPRVFSTWCPKVIALIGNLPETLEDRSIVIPMRRKAKHEKVARMRRSRLASELEPIRRRAARWAKDHLDGLQEAEPLVPQELHDRAADNWEPLVAIADLCGETWPAEARRAALVLSGLSDEADTNRKIQLLSDLHDLFNEHETDRLSSKQIVQLLVVMEGRPWPEYRMGKPLTENQLAALLKPFGVKPRGIRLTDGKTPRGYLRADLEDAFSRYLDSEPQRPQQTNDDGPSTRSENRNSDPGVAPPESDATPRQMAFVAPVAPRDRDSGEDEPQRHPQSDDWEVI